ncbi:MAG: helicase-exonuclease AddAB subunit AddA [Candidatus Brocadiia bacterium]|nr:MAG: helicase-exonuclease AddAB subunit AddA [Candidatus Brocadiia bacterium]
MSKKNNNWTEQQKTAITARGRDLLVTASAGTGKTAVLSGRCVDIVKDVSACPDVLRILVLTFTDMASEEMRSRIADQLRSAFGESKDSHLRRQLMLMAGADISTIHSFCRKIITEYFYKLGIDPSFRVMDDDEQRLLKDQCLEKTIAWAWQQDDLTVGLEHLFGRRDLRVSEGFASNIIEISDFIDTVTSRNKWYERAIYLAEAADMQMSEPAKKQKTLLLGRLEDIQSRIEFARDICTREALGGVLPAKTFDEVFINILAQAVEHCRSGRWEKCFDLIRDFKKPRVNKPKDIPDALAEVVKDTVKEAVGLFAGLVSLAVVNPDYVSIVGDAASMKTKMLVELVRQLDEFYTRAKQEINSMDFADLEHYALSLLSKDTDGQDNTTASETAMSLREKYKFIFVDEYQDINPVQQRILDLLCEKGRLFVVGDIKQSIYAFRGADPAIFLQQLRSASGEPRRTEGSLRVDLNTNFRSDRRILDFVNRVFSRIMSESIAGIDYDESAMLKACRENIESENDNAKVIEIHILDKPGRHERDNGREEEDGSEQAENIEASRRQAGVIARRIREMVGAETGKAQFRIFDKQLGAERDVEYRDIVILMRSPSIRVNDYVEVLRDSSVPVTCPGASGYFERTEIRDCLCLLKILDNPQRDIELAAVLRSPLFRVTESELALLNRLRTKNGGAGNFYDAVVDYSTGTTGDGLERQLKHFLETVEKWRTHARRGNIADVLWQVFRETGYLSFVTALPGGRQRRANLLKLHDRAIQFEGFGGGTGSASLSRFVKFVEKLESTGRDWSSAEPEGQQENAVRMMSVHKSKGLEFPVVFLAELQNGFNSADSRGDCLYRADDTVGLQVIDQANNSKIRSLSYQVIAEQKKSTMLAEEMRILYVAMTRARQRLVLTGTVKSEKCRDIITQGVLSGQKKIPSWRLRDYGSHLEWILSGLCDQLPIHQVFETGMSDGLKDDGLFEFNFYTGDGIDSLSRYVTDARAAKKGRTGTARKSSGKKESGLFSKVKRSLQWRYRFAGLPKLAAKQAVTQLTHQNDEFAVFDYSGATERRPKSLAADDQAAGIDARQIGIATHLLISNIDLAAPNTEETVRKRLDQLVSEGALSAALAERISIEAVLMFFKTDLGKSAINGNNIVYREWPFTFGVEADKAAVAKNLIIENCDDEIVVVQGIIDMLIETDEGLVVIDFKTDRIAAAQAGKRAELYRGQLELYGRAAQEILKVPVAGKWLYFLGPGVAVQI